MEVDQQAVLGGVAQDLQVVADHADAVAAEEVDLHALGADLAQPRKLAAARGRIEHEVARRQRRVVPRTGGVVPKPDADVALRRVGHQRTHALAADLRVPRGVDQQVVPVHVGRVVD